MQTITDEYQRIRDEAEARLAEARPAGKTRILVGLGTCGVAAGGREVLAALREKLSETGVDAQIIQVGCIGMCFNEPLVDIAKPGVPRISYGRVTPEMVSELVDDYLLGDNPRPDLAAAVIGDEAFRGIPSWKELPFFRGQHRRVLENCGIVDPEIVEDYIARDGYRALAKALAEMSPEGVIDEVKRSGLRGRGGAGFPTGLKWQFCYAAEGDEKYVLCNFDEGDPGAFMNRSEVEGDPHRLLEGMIIAAYAIGAHQGFIYGRAEYPLALQRLRKAIAQAEELGLLGDDILGSGFSFGITLKEGAGAFVCGEETALMASIEGRRGMPRPRPPFPAQSGLWGKPTLINNVGTLSNISGIILNGADWFAEIGTEDCKGTKVFSLVGKVTRSGLVEVPMGTSLGTIIFDIGGGILAGKEFKAIQTGGPSGGCLPASLLNLPVDYTSLTQAGSIMGSGGMVVMDEGTCMVDIARFFLSFTQSESCGKCVPCRLGTKRMLEILERITKGEGQLEDLDLLLDLAETVRDTSLCGLGQTAANPVLTTLRYFRDEFEAHILEKRCPAGECSDLVRCPCVNACPAGVDVPSYVTLVSEGRYAEALEMHRKRNPFALVCGRICPAFCERRCRREELDESVAIRQIKRFMADQECGNLWTPPVLEPTKGKKVAVIGSGPAGLTAALRLAQWGYDVTVHEALSVVGGMMAVGIPEYRLPRDVLQIEVESIKRAGVEIVVNSRLGRDFDLDDLFDRDGYEAVVLAIGAQTSRSLRVPGEDLEGVLGGTGFLRDVALGSAPDLAGKRVAVVGGGNTAIDAARTAMRLGAPEVHLAYRRTRDDMPAQELEIQEAEEEGLELHLLVNPTRIVGNGRVTGIELVRQELGEFDASARRRPHPMEGSEFMLPVDVVIPAIGQSVDNDCVGECGVEFNRNSTIQVGRQLCTDRQGVFAAGDAVLGPATVIEAVAQGNKVAQAVDEYLSDGSPLPKDEWLAYDEVPLSFNMEDYGDARRAEMPVRDPEVRRSSWDEVELGFSEEACREECKRCLRCDLEE